jgi:hypothetical protein
MATYIPGVGSYLPDFKPFTPDYKFLSNVLETKTLKYETNYKALNDLYSKVVYGDLSRADTQEMRDQYAENLGPKLQQISGMDLSMSQNVESAKALFKPFFEEDLIVKDLVTTKKYRNEMQYVDMLKNSPVKEERDQYWQTGVQKMQYEMEDFVNATEEDALKMALPQYVPDADLYEMAMGYLNESELGTDIVTTISDNGEWLVHRKNGDLITNEALTMVQKAMKDDPRVVNAYHADAFVKSRQYADQGIEEGRFATANEGQAAWASEQINTIEAEIARRNAELEKQKKAKEKNNEAWKKTQQQTGIVKGSKEEKIMNENASQLEALKQRLQDANLLLEDQPQAEVSMKTTGEYKPEDTKSLLYRAYSLLMNYNMESDLQAAALTYSNKGKMVKLEANPYMKMQKQHQYDLSKLATQNRYKLAQMDRKLELDKELADYEASLEATAGANFADLFSNVSTSDPNTVTGISVDEEGNVSVDPDFDYVESQENQIANWHDKNEQAKVEWALQMLQKSTDNAGSGVYSIDGIGEGSLIDLKDQILDAEGGVKEEYQKAFGDHFAKMGELIENVDPDVASLANGEGPLLLSSESGRDQFNNLQNTYVALKSQENALQSVTGKFYETAKSNLDKALMTSLNVEDSDEYQELMKQGAQNGMPQMFYEDANGVTRKYSLDEYKNVFAQWAAENGNKISIKNTPYDDTHWYTGRGSERMAVGDTWAGLGHGKSKTITYETRRVSDGLGGVYAEVPVERLGSTIGFQRDISDQQAKDFYNSMSEMMNYAMRGKLESVVNPEAHTGDQAKYTQMFDVYDVKQAMRGVDESMMNVGDIMNNPTYESIVDPLQLTPDAVEQLKNINYHMSQDPNISDNNVFLFSHGFNELQKAGNWDDEDVLVDGDMEENRGLGRKLWKQYTQDLVRMQAKGATKSDYPGVTIKYFPSWTSEGGNLDPEKHNAGYTITFDEDYLDQYRKKGGFLEGNTNNVVSIVVPKNADINSKKFGEFAFSNVATEISTNEQKNYSQQVPYGGSFNVTQNTSGAYDINYQIMQFDNETGQFKTAMFTEPMMDNNGSLIGQQNRQYLDFYTNQYLLQLQQVGNINQKTIDAWKKAHPDLVLNDPDYRFSN